MSNNQLDISKYVFLNSCPQETSRYSPMGSTDPIYRFYKVGTWPVYKICKLKFNQRLTEQDRLKWAKRCRGQL